MGAQRGSKGKETLREVALSLIKFPITCNTYKKSCIKYVHPSPNYYKSHISQIGYWRLLAFSFFIIVLTRAFAPPVTSGPSVRLSAAAAPPSMSGPSS